MSIKTHLHALQTKHAVLEKELHEAYTHHLPVGYIKKEKLKVKDEITQLEKSLFKNQKVAA